MQESDSLFDDFIWTFLAVLPSVVAVSEPGVHLAEDDTKLALLAGLQRVPESAMGEAVVADDGDVTLLPLQRNAIIIVYFHKGLQVWRNY